MNRNPKAKTTILGQGLLKGLKEMLEFEGGVTKSVQRIETEEQLKIAKDKISALKTSLLEEKNETMKPELQKAARVQVEALIREMEESVRVFESSGSRK